MRFLKLCWVGKHINITGTTKPSNSPQPKAIPTQEKMGLKVAFGPLKKVACGPLFPTEQDFFVGFGILILYRKTDYKEPNPTKLSASTLLAGVLVCWLVGSSFVGGPIDFSFVLGAQR